MKIAIPDDYQDVALEMVDWWALSESAEITAFSDCKGVYSLLMLAWRLSLYGFSDAWADHHRRLAPLVVNSSSAPCAGNRMLVREPN
jgi:hypothetical protein